MPKVKKDKMSSTTLENSIIFAESRQKRCF